MRFRTWPIVAIGFGAMALLTILSAAESWRRERQLYNTFLAIQQSQSETQEAFREIESAIYASGVFVRDFLLDPSHIAADSYRRQLLILRSSMQRNLEKLSHAERLGGHALLKELRRESDAYWDSLDPVFEWTPAQKVAFSAVFLRKQVLPRRSAVLGMADEVKALTASDVARQQSLLKTRVDEHRRKGKVLLTIGVAMGLIVAGGIVWRISRLENRAAMEALRTERAEAEMRRLSNKLVRAQEEERRNLARELHDEVGQMLTAMRVELGNLERLRNSPGDQFRSHLDDARQLAARTLRSVRALASGLRPSVLDDLGLGPAVQWEAREFSRRMGVPVEVVLEGLPDALPEAYRTCIYRIVQEGLTNIARHANAQQIRITLHGAGDQISLAIQDDGQGMPEYALQQRDIREGGLGLVGIEERVRELNGHFEIQSQPGKGTLLKASIPLSSEVRA